MWKKEDEQAPAKPVQTVTAARPGRVPETAAPSRSGFATIGPSIVIRGEVTGDEDLLIQGQVDGSVALGLHSVTVGDGGRVKAGITGRVITVEGSVEGDLSAEEQIILRGTARVKGDLNAPRVVLEDGASFRGLVDMGSANDLEPTKPGKPTESPDAKAATGSRSETGKESTGKAAAPEAPTPEGRSGTGGTSESRATSGKSGGG